MGKRNGGRWRAVAETASQIRLALEAKDVGVLETGVRHLSGGKHECNATGLMGKKLLVALTMEGKFAGEGLQSIDEDDDMLSAMARELVSKNGIGTVQMRCGEL